MGIIDWIIVAVVLFGVTYAAKTTSKYTKSVADFLSASRCAGRYLLAVAEGEAVLGAVSVITLFEIWQKTGFTRQFWAGAVIPLSLLMAVTGFVYYRYRQSRAMTLAQFFEMRYSRKFRIFSGMVSWISGVINFGLFPVIGARFFMNFCGFQSHVVPLGSFSLDLTLLAIMLVLIGFALFFTFMGGQIAVLVTDFWQGFFSMGVFVAVIVYLGYQFPWSQMSATLLDLSEPGKSLIDPLDIAGKKDFDFSFFATMMFFAVYNRMAWQGTQGYNSAAATPHEAKMSKIVGGIKYNMITLGLSLIPLAALTFLHHPLYANQAAEVAAQLEQSFPGNAALQTQMRIPVALSHMLPVGLIGAFTAAMLGFFISTNNTYMHSWGSIFVQDVICPLRKTPLPPKKHMLYLRLSIIGVAVFALFFGLLFPLQEYIWMFFAITGAIFLGGAGSVIIGGLYWKRGTAAGAWGAMITGSVVAVGSIALRIAWPNIPWLVERWGEALPINSQIMSFYAAACSIIAYVALSLLTKDPKVNMDELLHRGEYAVKEEEEQIKERVKEQKKIGRFWKYIGVNSHEFTKVDRGLFIYTFAISMFWLFGFITTLTLGLIGWMTEARWLTWWLITMSIWLSVGVVGVAWVGVGGLFDLRKMYKRLSELARNAKDDGTVSGRHNLADEEFEEARMDDDSVQEKKG